MILWRKQQHGTHLKLAKPIIPLVEKLYLGKGSIDLMRIEFEMLCLEFFLGMFDEFF